MRQYKRAEKKDGENFLSSYKAPVSASRLCLRPCSLPSLKINSPFNASSLSPVSATYK